jgi:hypothetical protein
MAVALREYTEDRRPEVRITHELHEAIDHAADVLSSDSLLFERDHELVTVLAAGDPVKRAPIAAGTPIIRPVSLPTLHERLTRLARFVKFKPPTEESPASWPRCQPTKPLIAGLLARGRWPVPTLVGISETPIMRPDGSLHETPGFDRETGYFYAPSCELAPMPAKPSQGDAVNALAEFEDAFVDFPHVSRAHKLVPIAAILTLLAKTAIDGPVPLFVLDASTRGSGKTLQADVISLTALGRDAGRLTHPESDEELEKILSAYALSGSRLILIDNITRTLGGGPLDKVLTTRSDVELRILGSTQMRRMPWTATVLASGNNVQLGDDTLRRTLVSRLESDLENPEARQGFTHDPLHAWVRAERPRLLRAAFIILRAYALKGWPKTDLPRWGSFEAWTQVVAGAIRFAGGENILECKPTSEDRGDGSVQALSVLLRELPRLGQGQSIKLKTVLSTLYPDVGQHDGPRQPDGFDDLRDSLETLSPPKAGHAIDARRLGKALRAASGRVLGGRRLRSEMNQGVAAYFIVGPDGKRL